MEVCVSIKCLNPHTIYDALRKHLIGLPYSLTEYLTDSFKCPQDTDIGYPKIECIKGRCRRRCIITNELNKPKHINNDRNISSDHITTNNDNWNKIIKYYVFEKVSEFNFDQSGQKMVYYRMGRIDKYAPLIDVYKLLQQRASDYLIHRYHVSCNTIYWKEFLEETDEYVLWLDYSMNMKFTPKTEAQSALYSGKQHTFHDCLIREPKTKKHTYVYHLNDSVTNNTNIRDIIQMFPEIIRSGKLILRSDNCSMQYKSLYVFQDLIDLSLRYGIQIIWFYGEAGHGRGLIDVMAWFGVKGPLRHTILSGDRWFRTAAEMVDYLSTYFADKEDYSKRIVLIDEGRKGHSIKGSFASHIISVKDGVATIRLSLDGSKEMFDLNFHAMAFDDSDSNDTDNDSEIDDNETVYDDEETDIAVGQHMELNSVVFEAATAGAVIALYTPSHVFEPFYFCKVYEVCIAENSITDPDRHCALRGEKYLKCRYLQVINQSKKGFQYKPLENKDVVVHPMHIFSPLVKIDDSLFLSMEEHLFLCDCM